jgi:hypothetical protein
MSQNVAETVLICVVFGGIPAILILGWIMRKTTDIRVRLACWAALALIAFLAWAIALPSARRTRDLSRQELVLVGGLLWGPWLGAAWLGWQWAQSRRRQKLRGFDVRPAEETPLAKPETP